MTRRPDLTEIVSSDGPLSPDEIRLIIRGFRGGGSTESELLEFKSSFTGDRRGWCGLLRELAAFANTEGGVIVLGIGNDGRLLGSDTRLVRSLDPAVVQDKLQTYSPGSSISTSVSLAKYYGKSYVAIKVKRSSRPIVFDKDCNYEVKDGKTETAFKAGAIYVRSPGKSHPALQQNILGILDRMTEDRVSKLLARIEQVAHLPLGGSIVAVPSPESSQGVLLVGKERGIRVRVAPEDPDAVPIAEILQEGPFVTEQSEIIAQVKCWRGDPEYRVDSTALTRWLISRSRIRWDAQSAEMCLHSALSRHGFPMFWAGLLTRKNLRKVVTDEMNRDTHPAIAVLPYVIRGFLWEESVNLLSRVVEGSSMALARNNALKLLSNDDPWWFVLHSRFPGRTARIVDNGNVEAFDIEELLGDVDLATGVFNTMMRMVRDGDLPTSSRTFLHQLDLLIHCPLSRAVRDAER